MPLQKLGGKEYYLGIFFKVKIIIFLLNVKPYTQKQRWEKRHFCRLTGTRRSSTAGSTACTWPASTARRNSASWRWGNRVNKILNWEAWTRPIPIYTFNSNGHTQYLFTFLRSTSRASGWGTSTSGAAARTRARRASKSLSLGPSVDDAGEM